MNVLKYYNFSGHEQAPEENDEDGEGRMDVEGGSGTRVSGNGIPINEASEAEISLCDIAFLKMYSGEMTPYQPDEITNFFANFNPASDVSNIAIEPPFSDLVSINKYNNITVPVEFIIQTIKKNPELTREIILQILPHDIILLIWQTAYFQNLFTK